MICEKCGHAMALGEWPFCPHGVGFATVVGDDIPGGMTIENLGPQPQTFYSKTEWKRAIAAAGAINRVEHKPLQGSDKSPHTTRWV